VNAAALPARRTWPAAAARIAGALALLWILAWQLDAWQRLPAFWPHLTSLQGAAALALTVPIIVSRALRWNIILRDLGRSFPPLELAVVYGSSLFLGLVTPGKIGEGSRIWFARERCRGGLPAAAFSVALDKILDVVPTLLGAVALLFAARAIPFTPSRTAWVALSVVVLLSVFVAVRPGTLQTAIAWIARRRSRPGETQAPASTSPLSNRALLKAFACSAAVHAFALGQSVLFAQAVGISLSPAALYGAICVGAVAAALPLSIGGLGSREIALVMGLTLLGVSREAAVDFSLFHLANSILTAVLTAPLLAAWRSRNPPLATA
jgi:uncharacterized membrane protein YbhN (UPF0104 family)